MKKTLITLCLLLTASWSQATLFRFPTSGNLGLAITDGNPVGVTSVGTVSGLAPVISSITVGLNITGGFNGNLYAYLVHDGTVVTLLNHIGTGTFGSMASGFGNGADNSFLLTTGAGSDLYGAAGNGTAGQALTGTFQVAGLSGFTGSTANGQWTLFFADTLRGGGTSTLNSWTLNITAVPEPVTLALVTFVAMLLALAGLKWTWRTK
jgi:subtilisin-like proprotein convertase family protein